MSGVYLEVQEGGVVLGSTELQDYPSNSGLWVIIFAQNASYTGKIGAFVCLQTRLTRIHRNFRKRDY